jgi:hypothetical protein
MDFNILVLKAAEQSKQDLRMCLTHSDLKRKDSG